MGAAVLPIPYRDPAVAFAPLAQESMSVLLDSAAASPQGRYSYIARDPFRVIRCTPHPWRVTIDGVPTEADPFTALGNALAQHPRQASGPVPFCGGAIGFLSYELGGVLERLPAPRDAPCPADMVFGFYDSVAAFDHERREAWVIAPSAQAAESLAAALGTAPLSTPLRVRGQWTQESPRATHEDRVRKTLDAIAAGEIYQANITQRFTAEIPAATPAFGLYQELRARAPAPFAAFLNTGDMAVMSASPERFLSVQAGGQVETRPIKGTRPRGKTPAEDAALAEDLRTSAKDQAENLMIVDLLRNDLARVCVPGSVRVPELCALTTFPAVHHLVSTVTGRLREGLGPLDLLRAAFPGGSITGAPKIRAMEIIHALEPGARGLYCGCIAWVGFDGAMDSSIIIRTLLKTGGRLMAQAGGGIVADSDPAQEYEECLVKVRPLLSVLEGPSP